MHWKGRMARELGRGSGQGKLESSSPGRHSAGEAGTQACTGHVLSGMGQVAEPSFPNALHPTFTPSKMLPT